MTALIDHGLMLTLGHDFFPAVSSRHVEQTERKYRCNITTRRSRRGIRFVSFVLLLFAGFGGEQVGAQGVLQINTPLSFLEGENAVDGRSTVDIVLELQPDATGAFCNPVNVSVSTDDGTALAGQDYVGLLRLEATLSLDPTTGRPTQSIPFTIIDDQSAESEERLQLAVSPINNPNCSTIDAATFTIVIADDDANLPSFINFQGTGSEVIEADTSITVSVDRSIGSSGAVSAIIEAEDGSAVNGSDFSFEPTTVSWADGDGEPKTVTVQINDDTVAENPESFSLVVSEVLDGAELGENTRFSITITDDADPTISIGGDIAVSAGPGDEVATTFMVENAIFPVTLSAELGAVTPAQLDSAGEATYTYTVPDSAEPGSTIGDLIEAVDGEGFTDQASVSIEVVENEREISTVPGLTPNQMKTAKWFDDACPRLQSLAQEQGLDADQQDLLGVCNGLRDDETTDDQVRSGLDAINPEEITVAATSAIRLTSVQHGNLSQRINALRSGATGVDLSGLEVSVGGRSVSGEQVAGFLGELLGGGASADEAGGDEPDRWGLFVNGEFRFGDKDGTADEQQFDFDVYGITVGTDYRFTPNLIFGAAVGYLHSKADFDSGSKTDVDTWSGMLFGTWYLENKFYVDGMLTYGSSDYNFDRRIRYTDATQTTDRKARGDTDGKQLSGGLAAGFDWTRGGLVFGPHAGAYYIDVDVDPYTETGAEGLNLHIGDQNAQSFTVNAGLHASYNVNTRWGVLVPYLTVDTVHEFQDDREFVRFAFVSDPFKDDPTDPSPGLSMRTDEADSQYFSLSAGFSAQFIHGVSGFLDYQRMTSMDEWTVNNVSFGLRFEQAF